VEHLKQWLAQSRIGRQWHRKGDGMEHSKENTEQRSTSEAPLPDEIGATVEVDVSAVVVDGDVHVDETVGVGTSEADVEEPTVESLQAELEAQRQKADEHLNHLQRLQAEFNNYRRRMAQEKLQAAGRGKVELLSSLLPVLNNLRLALQHADQDPESVRQGVQMIWQQCEEFLRSQGVEPIPTVGQPFDPMKHEALSIAPATEKNPPNTVVAEINAGYMLNGQLLRAAQVVVAQADESKMASADASEADVSEIGEGETTHAKTEHTSAETES
jgi:molecular chaperone GrpE